MYKRTILFTSLVSCGGAEQAAHPQHAQETPIVQAGDLVLRTPARDVDVATINTPAFQDIIAKMIRTMRQAPGVGLAAPQIGIPLRIIVLEDNAQLASRLTDDERKERGRIAFATRVFINPTLLTVGDGRATFFEGCLSVNGYVGLVQRSLEVEVSGLDEHGKAQTWQVKGWPARILQHEVDHLNGTLYIDRMFTRSFTSASQANALYGGKPITEIRKMLGL